MNMQVGGPPPQTSAASQPEVELARERTRQALIAGWTGGLSVFFAAIALGTAPTWPVAMGVTALAAMVAVICYAILRR